MDALAVGPPCEKHAQRRPLVRRTFERRVARRVVERVGGPAAARGELDRLGERDAVLVEGQRARPAEDAGRGKRLRVQPHDDRGAARGAGERDDAARTDLQAIELTEAALDLADEIARGDVDEAVPAGAARGRHDRSVGQEPVGRAAEDPARVRELGLHRRQRLQPRAVDEPVQVPPAAAVRDEVERAVGGPLGLDDRFIRTAGREDGLAERPVRGHRRDPQPGRVPRHVGVVPLEPGEPGSVRGEPRRRDEVRPRHEDARLAVAIERHVHDLVDGLATTAVVLADRDEAPPGGIEPEVRVSPRPGRGDRDRRRDPRVEPVDPAVREVRVRGHAAGDDVRAAAVLVGAGPDGDGGRGQVGDGTVRGRADQHAPAGLGRTALQPVDVVAVEPWLGQRDVVADEVIDPDRAPPRSVGGDRGVGHPRIRCRAARRRRTRPARRSSARARCRARPA